MVANVWRYYWRNSSFNLSLEPRWLDVRDPEAITPDIVVPRRVPFGSPQRCLHAFQEWIEVLLCLSTEISATVMIETGATSGAAR